MRCRDTGLDHHGRPTYYRPACSNASGSGRPISPRPGATVVTDNRPARVQFEQVTVRIPDGRPIVSDLTFEVGAVVSDRSAR